VPLEKEEPLKRELVQFLDSVKTRSRPLADGQAGLEALRIVEACYESSERGQRVEIDWRESIPSPSSFSQRGEEKP
jgi:predicted dehydrogenase